MIDIWATFGKSYL